MHRPSAQIASVLRLAGTATLAVLLALPAVGLTCPPEMGDFCPLQPAQECAMGTGQMDPAGHGMSEHRSPAPRETTPRESVGTGSGPMSCCIGADASAPDSRGVIPPTPQAPAAPFVAVQIADPAPARTPIPAPNADLYAPSPPLYTLHSILLS